MSATDEFVSINRGKADFSSIYVQADPRAYFRTLSALGYVIPHLASSVFDQLIEARQRAKRGPITVLDLGCSYGVNAALMKYAMNYDHITERYDSLANHALTPEQVLNLDRHYFASWPRKRDIRVIGLDISHEAVSYGVGSGILDAGIVANLEEDELFPRDADLLADVDLIVSTGCVGYITSKTFEKLAVCKANGEAPWVASFVLRMFDYNDIAGTLSRQKLVTQKFEGATFIQRRFRDEAEMRGTVEALAQRRLNPAGKEAEGLFHAELYFSRPEAESTAHPINRLVSVASGVNRNYGRRPRLAARQTH
ncbi:MAG: hypothetical protein VW600_01590 [Ferrovibrio sp.]